MREENNTLAISEANRPGVIRDMYSHEPTILLGPMIATPQFTPDAGNPVSLELF
jgi:hypothetical protein